MRILLAAGLCLSVAGCSSIGDLVNGEDGQRLYGGTQRNVSLINGEVTFAYVPFIQVMMGVCDFPCSFAMDTAFLPVTLVFAIARSGQPRLLIPPERRRGND